MSLDPSSASETGNNDQHLTVFRAADLIGDRVHIQTSGNEQQSASRENVMKITFRHEDPKKNNKHRKITVSRGRGRICKFCPSRSQNTAVKKMIKKGLHYMDVGVPLWERHGSDDHRSPPSAVRTPQCCCWIKRLLPLLSMNNHRPVFTALWDNSTRGHLLSGQVTYNSKINEIKCLNSLKWAILKIL